MQLKFQEMKILTRTAEAVLIFYIELNLRNLLYVIFFTIVFNSLWIKCSFNCIMLPDIDSTFFHVLCGNLIVSKGSLYVYLFELNLRNLLYVI